MMKSEFIERTNYTPAEDEYRFIEESYYDFEGDKDAFCKEWLKDKKSGAWEKELKLRKRILETESKFADELEQEKAVWEAKETALRKQQDELEAKIAELEEGVANLSKFGANKIEEVNKLMDEINEVRRDLTIYFKGSKEGDCMPFKALKYTEAADGFRFVTVVEENGFTTSYELDKIKWFEIM